VFRQRDRGRGTCPFPRTSQLGPWTMLVAQGGGGDSSTANLLLCRYLKDTGS